MINIENAYLFNQDNVKKDLVLDFEFFKIGNDKLYSEAFELTETLCSQDALVFGCCEASVLKFKCRNDFGNLQGKPFLAHFNVAGNTFNLGTYKVHSSTPSGDRKYTNVVAYDRMYDILNADVTEWYNSLEFPMTLRSFRQSFFNHLGIKEDDPILVNDEIMLERTIEAESISGKQVVTAICEINGVFGHMNRFGGFSYFSLAEKNQNMLYPSLELFPHDKLFTSSSSFDANAYVEKVTPGRYMSCEYEDINTNWISRLQIRQNKDDVGSIVGDGTNTYIIENNFLTYGKSEEDLYIIGQNLLSKISKIQYRPFKASLMGNPCLEVGDAIVIHTKQKRIESYVLERTLKGIQALKDAFQSSGVYEYAEKVNSKNKEIQRLKGKTNELTRTVELLNSEINDEEKGLKSQIKQTADEISTKVSKNEVVSEINQSAEEIKIKGEKISLEGTVTANDNFKILPDGSMRASNGTFEGAISSSDANISGGKINIRTADSENSAIVLTYSVEQLDLRPSEILLNAYDLGTQAVLSSFAFAIGTRSDPYVDISGADMEVNVDFVVHGSKNRVVKTQSYDTRKLYCYEMASPIFGDVGHGVVGADGLCYVDVDQVLLETIDTNQSYQVFLQSYSQHNVYVLERQSQYFIVKGEPHTEFDWELKAKQLDFSIERLDTYSKEKFKDEDYVCLASEYLRAYEQEVLDYEH